LSIRSGEIEETRQIRLYPKIMTDPSHAFSRRLFALVVAALFAPSPSQAFAESPYCNDLKAQIARAGSGGGSRDRAVAKQSNELSRLDDYARRIGCDRQQFLFFGQAPPPQCGQINARIAQMRANLGAYQQQNDNDASVKQALLARYDAQCRDRMAPTPARAGPRGFLDELFGGAPQPQPYGGLREVPLEDSGAGSQPPASDPPDEVFDDGAPMGGSEAVCVRQCDGGFFPVSYSARRNNLDDLNTLCKALCPGAEAALYTKSPWKDIDTALSVDGDAYTNHPNALKFQKTRDATCSCKPPDKNWAEALEDAERILSASHSKDTVVTAEQAEQLSRPVQPNAARDARNKSTRHDAQTSSAGATTSPPAAPAQSSAGRDQGVMREVIGPDGVKRRVRVVAPTL
jgi:hypothetical protein